MYLFKLSIIFQMTEMKNGQSDTMTRVDQEEKKDGLGQTVASHYNKYIHLLIK